MFIKRSKAEILQIVSGDEETDQKAKKALEESKKLTADGNKLESSKKLES